MKSTLQALSVLACVGSAAGASAASYTGVVTPTAVTYRFNSVSVVDVSGKRWAIVSDPFSYSFKRSDANFAPFTLKDVLVPFGRYTQLSVCFDTAPKVDIDGGVFRGHGGTAFNDGARIYTTRSDNAPGTLSSTNPGTTSDAAVSISTSPQNCSTNFFTRPVCVTDASHADCAAGDQVETGAEAASSDGGVADVTFSIYLMMDMFHGVAVDSTSGQIAGIDNLQVTVGAPGAAIHLAAGADATGDIADVSMLFGPDKALLAVQATKIYTGGRPGMCSGSAAVNLTGGPADAPVTSGIYFIGRFDPSGTGDLQVPATAACIDAAHCASTGVNHFSGFLQSVGSAASVQCIADADATPPFLGYSYAGGPGGDGSTVTLPIVRVVDPSGVFGICDGAHHLVTGNEGTCSIYDGADGYE